MRAPDRTPGVVLVTDTPSRPDRDSKRRWIERRREERRERIRAALRERRRRT